MIHSRGALLPVLYLRKDFTTTSKVKSAKLYATAQGVYKVFINGQKISDQELSPSWTDYNKTIQYQGYDVTKHISQSNAIGIILGTGWYTGNLGPIFGKGYDIYGTDQFALAQMHIEFENNKTLIINTDNTWKITTGPVIYSDILMGELYYESRLNSIKGFDRPQYNDSHWLSVVTKAIDKKVELVAEMAQPIRVTHEITPKTKYQSSPGVWVFDFEQNFAGWVRMQFKADIKPSRIQIRHAEVLNPNGTVYTLNLRAALATDTYVLSSNTIMISIELISK